MSHDIAPAALKNLLHRAGWALSLVPQVVSAAQYTERHEWNGEVIGVLNGVSGYENLAHSLVREINAAIGTDLRTLEADGEDPFAAVKRLAGEPRRNPSPRARRPKRAKAPRRANRPRARRR